MSFISVRFQPKFYCYPYADTERVEIGFFFNPRILNKIRGVILTYVFFLWCTGRLKLPVFTPCPRVAMKILIIYVHILLINTLHQHTMGQDLSKSLIPPPFTLLDCLVNGKLDFARYIYFRRKQDYIDLDNQFVAISIGNKRKAPCSQDSIKP